VRMTAEIDGSLRKSSVEMDLSTEGNTHPRSENNGMRQGIERFICVGINLLRDAV